MSGVFIAGGLLVVIFGLVWLQKAIYFRYWNKNLVYGMSSSKNAVFEGEKITITDSLSNGKRLPLPWVHVRYKLSRSLVFLDNVNKKINRGERRSLLYIVGMNKAVSRKSTVLCSKRGYYTVSDFSIASNNLFMTGFVTEKLSLRFGLLVYPRLVEYPESVIPLKKMLGDTVVKRFIDPDPFTFKGVREYQPYDSFRQINWSCTAKAGTLMSNIYDFTVYQDITVMLELKDFRDYNRAFVHEEAIRLAAFFCRKCVETGIPVSLICPAADGNPMRISSGLSKGHLATIYTALAFIDLTVLNHPITAQAPSSDNNACILITSISEKFKIELTAGGETTVMEVQNALG
jgi:uncharacterized protein (DUF58 family)